VKITFSQAAAAVAIIGFASWALTAQVDTALAEAPEVAEKATEPVALPQVETLVSKAMPYDRQAVLQGQIEPWRSVALRTQIAGTIESVWVAQGDHVKKGQRMIQLSKTEYQAQLQSAKASVRLKQSQLEGARKLYKTKLQTETEVLRLESELESARASEVMAQQQLNHAQPAAPFDGVLDYLDAELGQYMNAGEEWARLVNIDRLKATAEIPQQDVAAVSVGQSVDIDLLDGRRLNGTVSFIASAASTGTRSFPIEVVFNNPEQQRIAGASATLNIHLGSVLAHQLSPALLSLGDKGELGVKWVNEHDQVVFQTVKLLSTGTDGAWVTGLPDRVAVISLGGGFVSHGQKVVAKRGAN